MATLDLFVGDEVYESDEQPELQKYNYFDLLSDQADSYAVNYDANFDVGLHLRQLMEQERDQTAKERNQAFFRMPPVFLSMITEYLSAQDLFILRLTGDMALRRFLGDYGGLKSLRMDLYLEKQVRAPFRFIGSFSQLRSLHICEQEGIHSFYRSVEGDTDLTCLPRTLTSLNFTIKHVLELFYNAQELALTIGIDSSLHTKGENPESPLVITEYKRAGPDYSKIFYNLDELFPNLVNLELASIDGCGLPAVSIPHYDTRVAQHLIRSYETKLICPKAFWDEDTDESYSILNDLSVDQAFIESLPRGLRSLRLDFQWTWHYQSLDKLPSTLTDLTVYAISTIFRESGELDDDAPYFSEEDLDQFNLTELHGSRSTKPTPKKEWYVPLSEAPLLPSSLTRLVLRTEISQQCIEALTERLPSGLQALKLAGPCIFMKTEFLEALPSDLQSLKVDFDEHFDMYRIPAFLPRQLTVLSMCYISGVTQNQRSNVKFIEWPLTLTRLEIGFPNECQNVLLESLESLSQLTHLRVCFSEYERRTGSIWPAAMGSLPATLRTLILSEVSIHEPDLRVLPQGLTYLKVTRPYGHSAHQRVPLTANAFPPNLKRLKLWGNSPSRQTLPNIFSLVSPNLGSLSLHLNKPSGRPTEFNWETFIPPQIYHLTHLRLLTNISPPKKLTQCLPRTLTKFAYKGSGAPLGHVVDLPKKLLKLHVTLLISSNDFSHLPRHLVSLKCQIMARPHKKKQNKTKSKSERENEVANCFSHLPRSLTHLALKNATECTTAIISRLPATLAAHCANQNGLTFGQDTLYIPRLPNGKFCWFYDNDY